MFLKTDCTKMKKLLLILMILFWQIGIAQIKEATNVFNETSYDFEILRPLKIGETMPDILVKGLINFQNNQARISDFKGKLLIIDFWATWCSPCIKSFSKLDSLQKQFSKNLQILPVTYEPKNLVQDFLVKYNQNTGIQVSTATEDTTLKLLFPYAILPHYVWIDENRKVIAITENKAVSTENIRHYFETGEVRYSLKQESTNRIMASSSIFRPSILLKDKITGSVNVKLIDTAEVKIHSILTKYMDGIYSGAGFISEGNIGYVLVTNRSIQGLYRVALLGNSLASLNATTMIVEIPDTNIYKVVTSINPDGSKPSSGLDALQWLKTNGYCYELTVPKDLEERRFEIMLHDLNRYYGMLYGIEGVVEERLGNYLALVRISNEDKLSSSGGEKIIVSDKFSFVMRNAYLSSFIGNLAIPLQNYPPIINETGIEGKVDLKLHCQLSDLTKLNEELRKYDLQLIEKSKVMQFAIIKVKR